MIAIQSNVLRIKHTRNRPKIRRRGRYDSMIGRPFPIRWHVKTDRILSWNPTHLASLPIIISMCICHMHRSVTVGSAPPHRYRSQPTFLIKVRAKHRPCMSLHFQDISPSQHPHYLFRHSLRAAHQPKAVGRR